MPVLDLRPLAPPERHRLVYEQLDALAPGETLELVNDHRPSPLRYELEATRPGQYRWASAWLTTATRGPSIRSVRSISRP